MVFIKKMFTITNHGIRVTKVQKDEFYAIFVKEQYKEEEFKKAETRTSRIWSTRISLHTGYFDVHKLNTISNLFVSY